MPENIAPSSVASWFAADGPLAQQLPAFESRPQQPAMAEAVQHALTDGRHLIVEAGTGVGKSLAYLLPAALWAVRHDKRVLVVTHTRALQEQLVQRELPLVRELLAEQGLTCRYALLMGASNYLCRQRLVRVLQDGAELFGEPETASLLRQLATWSETAASGLRSQMPCDVPPSVWDAICKDPDLCLGRRGPEWERCLYRKDLERSRRAHIVVLNQHLFFAGLPVTDIDAIIFDEAHQIEEVAAQFLGISVTSHRVRRLLDEMASAKQQRGLAWRMRHPDPRWAPTVASAVRVARGAARQFFGALQEVAASVPERRGVVDDLRARRVRQPDIVPDVLSEPVGVIVRLLKEAVSQSASSEDEAILTAYTERCERLVDDVRMLLACDRPASAYWVEVGDGSRAPTAFCMAPLDVSGVLRESIFGLGRPVVLTSATLAVDGSLAMVRSRLGMDEGDELILDSPFNHRRQSICYIDQRMPDPALQAEAYERRVIDQCVAVVERAPGGVLVLHTSHRAAGKTAQALRHALGERRPLFCQGEREPYALLEAFRAAGNGVLIGTDTFWQGIDVVGEALTCVVVARLPFASPGSPLEEARREWLTSQGIDPFDGSTLPRAILKFRQGVGRLIRCSTDYGAIVVLDPRIVTKRYGASFLRAIPACRQTGSLDEVASFLSARSASPNEPVYIPDPQ